MPFASPELSEMHGCRNTYPWVAYYRAALAPRSPGILSLRARYCTGGQKYQSPPSAHTVHTPAAGRRELVYVHRDFGPSLSGGRRGGEGGGRSPVGSGRLVLTKASELWVWSYGEHRKDKRCKNWYLDRRASSAHRQRIRSSCTQQ